jgi:type IV fimbrial biogenesis protein FimT
MYIAAAPMRATPVSARVEGGFTIIELMVVVALLAILAGLAAPSFTDMFRRFRVDSVRETFASSVTLAREEAIRTGTPMVIRRTTGCGLALANNQDWSCGWRVFADLDGNNTMNGAEASTQEVSLTPNVTVRKGNSTNPEFIVINRFGQVAQVDQRFEVFPTGMAATDGQLICFTAGTRLRTVKNASACP